MHHDLPGGRREEADPSATSGAGTTADEQARQIRFLEEEVALLRRKLTDSPRQNRVLEQRLAEASEG
jgi:proteasome-associated ATPase